MELTKVCPCGRIMHKKDKLRSWKAWNEAKYCSTQCAGKFKRKYRPKKRVELQTVTCACGCGITFKKRIYEKGKINYFSQSRHFYNQDHFKKQREIEYQENIRKNIII